MRDLPIRIEYPAPIPSNGDPAAFQGGLSYRINRSLNERRLGKIRKTGTSCRIGVEQFGDFDHL